MAGFEPAPQGLEGPQAAVTPHSRRFGLRVTFGAPEVNSVAPFNRDPFGIARARPSALATRDAPSTPRPNVGPVSFTGPSTSVSCQRPRSCELVGGMGFEPARVGDSARIRTRTLKLWRLGCSRYTTLPMSHHVSTISKTEPPCDLARTSSGRQAKTKRPSRGSP